MFEEILRFNLDYIIDISIVDIGVAFIKTAEGEITLNGAVQYMVAPDEDVTAHLTDLDVVANHDKVYTLNPTSIEVLDAISFTKTAGVYSVTEGLKATNDNGDVVVYDKDTT